MGSLVEACTADRLVTPVGICHLRASRGPDARVAKREYQRCRDDKFQKCPEFNSLPGSRFPQLALRPLVPGDKGASDTVAHDPWWRPRLGVCAGLRSRRLRSYWSSSCKGFLYVTS